MCSSNNSFKKALAFSFHFSLYLIENTDDGDVCVDDSSDDSNDDEDDVN
jgi:hypothetical protein